MQFLVYNTGFQFDRKFHYKLNFFNYDYQSFILIFNDGNKRCE